MGFPPEIVMVKHRVKSKKHFRKFKRFRKHLVLYRENNGEIVWTQRFLFKPKKFQDGWHWFSWVYLRHTPLGLDWADEWFSEDDFLVYKLSNDLEKA